MNESSSIFSALKGLNLNKILNTASKTLNFVNKAIPMYQEIRPTIGSITKIFNKATPEDTSKDEIKESRPIKLNKKKSTDNNDRNSSNDTLTFFQ